MPVTTLVLTPTIEWTLNQSYFVLPAPVAGVLSRTLDAERVFATSRNGFLGRRSLRLAGRKPCADTEEPKQRSDSYRARKRAA
jgi:hypothetical protein